MRVVDDCNEGELGDEAGRLEGQLLGCEWKFRLREGRVPGDYRQDGCRG